MRIWCRWAPFYASIDERRLTEVLADLRGLPFDVFQIDDGWQQAIGDWQANDRFPSGLADLASRSRDQGLEPGLWIAPFSWCANSDVFGANRSMFASDDSGDLLFAGRNWGGECYASCDAPGDTGVHQRHDLDGGRGGFTYLKLDFLLRRGAPWPPSHRGAARQAYRDAVELVRRAAGDDVYLLVRASIIPSIGVFDGIRVGPDVAPWLEMPLVTEYLHDVTAPATRYAIATVAESAVATPRDRDRSRRRVLPLQVQPARSPGPHDAAGPRSGGWLSRHVRPACVARRPGTSGARRVLREALIAPIGHHRYEIDGRGGRLLRSRGNVDPDLGLGPASRSGAGRTRTRLSLCLVRCTHDGALLA